MERIITSIKGPVLALADKYKYLPRSRKIQRLQRCVSSQMDVNNGNIEADEMDSK